MKPAAVPSPMLSNHGNTMLLAQRFHGWGRRSRSTARYAGLALLSCSVWMGVDGAPARQESATPVPPEHQPYVNARSVVNQPQSELIKQYPELDEVEFAQSQEELPLLLEKVGEGVEALFRDFVNTASTERITQDVGRPPVFSPTLTSTCNYLVLAQRGEKMITLEEFRTNHKGEPIDQSRHYLLTSGFASVPLFFHPLYQPDSAFRYIGRQTKGRRLHIIGFAQRPEAAGLIGYFHLAGRPAVILSQGLAWIDPDTCRIVRMRTDLLAPRYDILLARQTSEVELGEVSFEGAPRPLWLPRKVVVTIDWQHTIYRNQHRYRDYKLFSVETREDKKEIVRPPGQILQ
jgi:hypothetical protein